MRQEVRKSSLSGQVYTDSRERETMEILGRQRASLKNSLCKGPVAEGALGAWLGRQGGGGARRGHSGVPRSAPGPGGTAWSRTRRSAGAHSCREGVGPTGASARVGVCGPRLKAQHSTRPLPASQRSGRPSQRALSPRAVPEGGGSARLDSEKESGKGQVALLVCSGRAVRLPPPGAGTGRQPPPAGARCRSQDAGGGKGDAAAPGGWTAGGRAERKRGPPRPGDGRGWLHRWAGGTQRLTPPAKACPPLVPWSFLGDESQSEASTVIILNLLCFK